MEPCPALEHVRRHQLAHDECGRHAPVERVPEVFVGDVEKPRIRGTADIVDENVDAAETLHGRF